jgi:hypothetical protein
LLTLNVNAEARKKTPIVSHDFHTNFWSWSSNQIIARDSTVPATMQMVQIVKQILFSFWKFMDAP